MLDGPVDATTEAGAKHCEALVIGGGPAGAATAIFLRKAGFDVVLVEKDHHPRFHIGESLLPHSLPLLEKLGVLEKVSEMGVAKPGAEFISVDGEKSSVFEFARALTEGPPGAYQVPRDEFDRILFEKAKEQGAVALSGTKARVLDVSSQGAKVELRTRDGAPQIYEADYLIDASGRSTVMAKLRKEKMADPRSNSAAIYGHFTGVPRAEGPNGGNIRIHMAQPGWFWEIPLPAGVTSIGFVAPGDYLSQRNAEIADFFEAECKKYPSMRHLMANSALQGEIRATGNFSYRAERAAAPCHFKVGDAFGFIDPIFSTGVHLALFSAEEAARALSAIQAGRIRREPAARNYHRLIERRLDYVSWFITKSQTPAFRRLMLNPRDFWGVERAVVALLAGDFRGTFPVVWRLFLFKAIWKSSQLGEKMRGAQNV